MSSSPAAPPRFDLHSPYGEARSELAVGDELRLPFSVRSVGGASQGLSITLWGDAIDAGFVAVERFEFVAGNVLRGARHTTHEPVARTSTAGQRLLCLELPAQELIAGVSAPALGPGVGVRAVMDDWARAIVHVNVVGRVVAPGEGSVWCGFAPHANRVEGAQAAVYRLTADPTFAQPIRANLFQSADDKSAWGLYWNRPIKRSERD